MACSSTRSTCVISMRMWAIFVYTSDGTIITCDRKVILSGGDKIMCSSFTLVCDEFIKLCGDNSYACDNYISVCDRVVIQCD